MVNKDNRKLYKAVNNKILLMWYQSKNEWCRCCTTYEDIMSGDYIDTFMLISEENSSIYK